MSVEGEIDIHFELTNHGHMAATEVAQMYIRDRFGSVTRPVRELKDFTRVHLEPGETKTVHFKLRASQLAFYDREMEYSVEPGAFDLWVGGNSNAAAHLHFNITD
jgi:beta-glucosidase